MLLIGGHGNGSPCGSDGSIPLLSTSSVNSGVGMRNGLYEWSFLLQDRMFIAHS